MALFLIAIIVLQFVGANFGAHQLHAANGAEESDNHPHLQFSAQVTVYSECVDCMCPTETGSVTWPEFAGTFAGAEAGSHAGALASAEHERVAHAHGFHSHLVKITETQDFDLCLDCQCHGGHVALLTQVVNQPVLAGECVYIAPELTYLAPDNFPKYRP
ncbi:MAG: hypothetical protein ACRDA8_18880, partial [Shewanella sp.]